MVRFRVAVNVHVQGTDSHSEELRSREWALLFPTPST